MYCFVVLRHTSWCCRWRRNHADTGRLAALFAFLFSHRSHEWDIVTASKIKLTGSSKFSSKWNLYN